MTVLVLVAFPDPHSELQEPQELHEDTWQSITGEKRQMNIDIVFDGVYHEPFCISMCDVFMGAYV